MTLRSIVGDFVVASLVSNKRMLRNLQMQRGVNATHRDGSPLVSLDGRIPEQRRAADRAGAALNLLGRLVPPDGLCSPYLKSGPLYVDSSPVVASVLSAL